MVEEEPKREAKITYPQSLTVKKTVPCLDGGNSKRENSESSPKRNK